MLRQHLTGGGRLLPALAELFTPPCWSCMTGSDHEYCKMYTSYILGNRACKFFTVPGYFAKKTGGLVIRDQYYVMHFFWRSRGHVPYRLIACRFSRLTVQPRQRWSSVPFATPSTTWDFDSMYVALNLMLWQQHRALLAFSALHAVNKRYRKMLITSCCLALFFSRGLHGYPFCTLILSRSAHHFFFHLKLNKIAFPSTGRGFESLMQRSFRDL